MEPKKRSIPMTDGTPVACRQKNAEEFLAGNVPGVMAQYGLGLFGPAQQQHSREIGFVLDSPINSARSQNILLNRLNYS